MSKISVVVQRDIHLSRIITTPRLLLHGLGSIMRLPSPITFSCSIGNRQLRPLVRLTSPSPPDPLKLDDLITSIGNLQHAAQIHAQIIANGYLHHPLIFTNLLNAYFRCGRIRDSLMLFSSSRNVSKNVVSWTSLITHLFRLGKTSQALSFFDDMRCSGVYPNHYTFSAILSACAESGIPSRGERVHCLVVKDGLKGDVFVGSALVDMYVKCSDVSSAEKVFGEMTDRSIVSWNAMIVGYLQNDLYDKAIRAFGKVFREGLVAPDEVSFSSVLSACANSGSSDFGRQVHALAVKLMIVVLVYVTNSLLDMYCKCTMLDDALRLFGTIRNKVAVTWNIMMMGFCHNGHYEEACYSFWSMRREGVSPDEVSFSSVLHAAACLSTLHQGASMHNQVIKHGVAKNSIVLSALITMYAKCGDLASAHLVFEEIEDLTVVCWSAMIAAFQQHGHADQVLKAFDGMLGKGIRPDHITLVSVLSACSYAGQVDEGYNYFNSMKESYGIDPGYEHYACMVDLLGRAGRLEEAKRFIESMPMSIDADSSIWGALLGACSNHGNLDMAREVADRLFLIEPGNSGNYVLLSNMYLRKGKQKEADEVRKLMVASGVRKEPGCSWIDVKNKTVVFTSHDMSHPMTNAIYNMVARLEELVKEKGYTPQVQFAVNDTEVYKERSLWYHSEKLALAFGLLTLPNGAPIRIKKNLRTCGDCHSVMKFASEIFGREIIVRDINRFHRFADGACSCGDYW